MADPDLLGFRFQGQHSGAGAGDSSTASAPSMNLIRKGLLSSGYPLVN